MELLKCSGLLTVGDPHLSERKPARRLDHDYLGTVLYKLQQAADIANENDAQMIIMGDLFDDGIECGNKMMYGLYTILNSCKYKPICLAGNHDLTETKLTKNTTLHTVAATGLLDVIKSPGFVRAFDIDGQIVGLGATPYGFKIPNDTTDVWPLKVDQAMWITHTDIAFPGAYPGAISFFDIKGVDIVVNGHMHLTQDNHLEGSTLWTNPGNIIRQSVDTLEHTPKVALYTPTNGQTTIELNFTKDSFNLEGYLVQPADKDVITEDLESCFAALMAEDANDRKMSDDAGYLREDIDQLKSEVKLSPAAQAIVEAVYQEGVTITQNNSL